MAGLMRKLLEEVVFGIVVALAVFVVTWHFETQRADNDQRLENLRFVREHSSDDLNQPRPFRGLDLAHQNLSGLRLPQAQLVGANLAKADLRFTLLSGAQFRAANLQEAQSTQTSLNGTQFIYAQLHGAWIDKSFAKNASFKGSNLSDVNFSGTSLQGADFSGAVGLDKANLSKVCWDGSTRWPAGFTPPPSEDAQNCPS
jgi:uncharacterized protein YjbI with pentapeptide repeats